MMEICKLKYDQEKKTNKKNDYLKMRRCLLELFLYFNYYYYNKEKADNEERDNFVVITNEKLGDRRSRTLQGKE